MTFEGHAIVALMNFLPWVLKDQTLSQKLSEIGSSQQRQLDTRLYRQLDTRLYQTAHFHQWI
jgi:hypothetical protein